MPFNGQGGMKLLTAAENKYIEDVRRILKRKPKSLLFYVCDDTVIICKSGISSDDVSATVGRNFSPCAVLTDAHDDNGYGA